MKNTAAPAPTFTNDAYVRSHTNVPRTAGTWLFQASRTRSAFSADLHGPVLSFWGRNVTEAKAALKAAGHTGLFALLP